ncbi:OmpA family protein [Roseovarius sp. SCSIO 43702]|uniref:OmpA family protein n=1 Tax=Roseovarius sp. SCSIO 43702 TaxID=2823043 RepID=UPI001C73A400|nr:OmpA family protein [Roseovarius sp. SCSIO 43702]QYX57553.1 OmpA family protein [Roseovarius sp. SCSIO 43702]
MKRTATLITLLALAACGRAPSEVSGSYFNEAGALVDGGNFGNATMQNHQVMTGERGYVHNLSNRFANEVDTTVNFAFNSAQLDARARHILSEQAAWIRQFPEVTFRVYGHTDKVGSNAYNKRLGLARARAVVAFFASQGISTSRLEALVSFGETQPLIVTQGRERRNRRTVTEVSGFVQSHPVIMDGKYAQVIYREYIQSAVPKSDIALAKAIEDASGASSSGGGGE